MPQCKQLLVPASEPLNICRLSSSTDLSACDERSDIYSFGIVLYQMASGGRLPFSADNPAFRWTALKHFHQETPVPKLNSPLFPIIQRCLEKDPGKRYQTFKELRLDIEVILKQQTGQTIKLPDQQELDWWEWNDRGISLYNLGELQKAIVCYEKALELEPRQGYSWNNKGLSLSKLGRHEEAIACYEKALEIDCRYANAWTNKCISLSKLGRHEEAIASSDKALGINPRDVNAWTIKGIILLQRGKHQEAIVCYNKALEINPRDEVTRSNKGISLSKLGRHEEAIACYEKALAINPIFAQAWFNKGVAEDELNRTQDTINSFKQFLRLTSADDSAIANVRKRIEELSK